MPLRDENEERAPRSAENYEPADTEEYEAEFGDIFATNPSDGSVDEVFKAWNPLAVVIQKCRHISDLIWVCRNQLPRCVFQTITQHHPSCRLELRSFRLLSLREPITDTHERDLIQSPCLHSISVKTVRCDGKICSGDTIVFQTDDPEQRPLPSVALLEMQWTLHRVLAMSGAADAPDPEGMETDSDSKNSQMFLEEEEEEGEEEDEDEEILVVTPVSGA